MTFRTFIATLYFVFAASQVYWLARSWIVARRRIRSKTIRAAVVVAGSFTAYLAVAHQDPLVVDNYYKEGLGINRVIEQDRSAARADVRAELMFADSGKRVRVHLAGTGPLPQSLRLHMAHPTRADLDRAAILTASQEGWYEGEIGIPGAPRWDVQLEDEAATWRLTGAWRPADGAALALRPHG
jgi:hypothetical protein